MTKHYPQVGVFSRAAWLSICAVMMLVVMSPAIARSQDAVVDSPGQDQKPATANDADSPQDVSLTIDFGDLSQQKFVAIPWRDGMTVLDAMRSVEKHPRAAKFRFRGQQQTAFLEEMGGLANQGGDGRNWMFRVSGKIAKQSFAATTLQPGDDVLWEFR
jgi:hypothetical protein